MDLPDQLLINGVRYVRDPERPDSANVWVMYDNHTFGKIEVSSIDEIQMVYLKEVVRPGPRGIPSLCPIRLMHGLKVVREIGEMVHEGKLDLLDKWLEAARADTDFERLLKEKKL